MGKRLLMLYALIIHLCALSQPVTAINDSLLCRRIDKNGIELLNIKTGKLFTINSTTLEKLMAGDTVATGNLNPNHAIIAEPASWRTAWFITLCIVILAGLLFAFYRYRVNQFIHLQQVRNRIATDLHDDIGTTLTNISILSELSKKYLLQKEQAGVFLDRIEEEVANSGQALDDIVWSINTKNDTLEQTVARMRRYVAELFDAANITYSLQLDEQFEQYKLNMEQRRDCFLIFKESINNIYKHANAQHVHIKVWIDKSHLFMTIKDDGKGFDITAATHRNGIKNIRNRIQKWRGTLTINSAEGEGTVTELTMPVRGREYK
jgi:signal transduction histidine kinase